MPLRRLSVTELAEARRVFADGLDYARLQVREATYFPNLIADLGAALRGQRRTANNAITLGQTCYFPVRLNTTPQALAAGDLTDMAWLMHELTHAWQYQRWGWRYLSEALQAQMRLGRAAYDYAHAASSPAAALLAARAAGRRWADFNPEQQGDLARDYYLAVRRGQDSAPWDPFVAELRR